MAGNAAYAGTAPGIVKLLHLLFGVIAIGCGGHSYSSEYVFQRVFLWSAVTCFIISFIYFIIHLASDGVARSSANKGVDILYHILAGILLIAGGSLMIVSVKNYDKNHCNPYPWGGTCQDWKSEKLAGGAFSIINGLFYLIAVILIGLQRQEDPADTWDTKIRGYSAPPPKPSSAPPPAASEPRE